MLLVLMTAAWNIVRLVTAIAWVGVLESYAPRPGPSYTVATGLVWTAAAVIVFWGLHRRASWALLALLGGAWAYAVWVWLDRVLLQAGGPPNWEFALVISGVLLGFVTAVALNRDIKAHFGREAHERETQD